MFTSMAEDVLRRVTKATAEHRQAMDVEEDRKIAYSLTQKLVVADEVRLDYGVVRMSSVLSRTGSDTMCSPFGL